ncbi:MAG TPA: TonB-dependent receptor [Candidatus Acidoferrales bacterium]|nr:TonB-dependent receptor [Candidatus Acidoferrales bacterium]
MTKNLTTALSVFFLFAANAFSQTQQAESPTGTITGYVTDAKTGQPLVGVTVLINELKNVGAATDEDGRFKIWAPVGSYSLRASLIGYQAVIKTDIIVTTGGETHVAIKMSETALELNQVTVTPDYFDKAASENPMSTVSLGSEEIRRSPGSDMDYQRILQAMPGVSFSTDQTNELLVRGGAPDENLTVFDHMEIQSTNHYPNEYNSGGPINMVNVDLIQDVQFSTGGFISKYGDKSSSVINITTREGTRDKLLTGNANLSMAGYGTVLEGSINGGQGSWILSARNSFLDLIAGAVGLTAVPRYYDLQSKVVYDLSETHKLSFSGIYGNDRIDIAGEPQITDLALAGSSDSVDVYNVNVRQHQYAAGLTLNSKWSEKFVSIITISKNDYNNDNLVTSDFTQRRYGTDGKVFATNILTSRKIYGDNNDEGETTLNAEFILNANKVNELNFGGAAKFIYFRAIESADGDTARYNFGAFDTTVVVPAANINYDFRFPQYYKAYGYFNDRISLFDERLVFNIGVRYDYFSYSGNGNMSPRFSASYSIVPNVTTVNLAVGKYYQTPPLPDFGDRYQSGVNRYLSCSLADHYVLGIEDILAEGLKFDIEGYYKKYSGLPTSEDFIHFSDQTFRSEQIVNVGREDVYGIDLLVQQKLVQDIYGTICFSRMFSKYYDPRLGMEGKTFPSWYDTPYVLTVIAGKRFANLRSDLDAMPFYIKYPSYVLPFSNDMEMSARWRYSSGMPYTPQIYVASEQHREGGITWTRGWWEATNDINSARYPDYHRLDLELSSRFNFRTWNLVILFSVQNIYNRKNIAYYQYNSDGSRENVYQFALLPVVGIEAEF